MTPLGIFSRGLAMGAADIVPGVSGGTIALITGIYPRLLAALHQFDLQLLGLLRRAEVKAAWRHVDGLFLLCLVGGIATSLVTLAQVISWLLETHPQPLWSFFFGLILASALLLMREVERWSASTVVALLGGIAFALWVAISPSVEFVAGYPGIFLAGFIAICAMILPGISGSFILLLLGMYSSVLVALKGFDIAFLMVFAVGAGLGLLSFSRLLYWLFQRFYSFTLAMLTGFLLGSLAIVWPWKRVLEWIVGRHGELRPVQQWPVLPDEFLMRTGQDPALVLSVLCGCAGFFCVWLIDRYLGQLHVEAK